MTKTTDRADTTPIPPLLFSPFMVGDAYLRSIKQTAPGQAATIVEQLNNDFMLLAQKQMELAAVWMNVWAHALRLPIPQQAAPSSE